MNSSDENQPQKVFKSMNFDSPAGKISDDKNAKQRQSKQNNESKKSAEDGENQIDYESQPEVKMQIFPGFLPLVLMLVLLFTLVDKIYIARAWAITAIANARAPYPHVDMAATNYLIKVLGTQSPGGASIIYKDMLKKLQNLPEQTDGSVAVARLTFLNKWFDAENLGKDRYLHELELIIPKLPAEDEINLSSEISTQVYRSAVKTEDYGESEKALELYSKALAYSNRDSGNANKVRIQGNMGSLYERLGRNDEALRYFLAAVDDSPPDMKTNGQAWRLGHIGFNLMKQYRFREAIPYLRKAIEMGDATRLTEVKQYGEWLEICRSGGRVN